MVKHFKKDIVLLICTETPVRVNINFQPKNGPAELILPENPGPNPDSTDNQKLSVDHPHRQGLPHKRNEHIFDVLRSRNDRLIIRGSRPGMRYSVTL